VKKNFPFSPNSACSDAQDFASSSVIPSWPATYRAIAGRMETA